MMWTKRVRTIVEAQIVFTMYQYSLEMIVLSCFMMNDREKGNLNEGKWGNWAEK